MEAANFENPTSPSEVIDLINNYHKAGDPFLFLKKLEAGGTLLFADEERVREWETWGAIEGSRVVRSVEKIDEILQPLIGSEVVGGANWTCYRDKNGDWHEETEEYGPKSSRGVVEGVQAMVVELTDYYPKKLGDHVPGRYPKEGTFEHYRICLSLGEVALPLFQFNGGWNKLRLAENAKLL